MKNTFSRTVLVMFLAVLLIATCACSFTEQKSYVGSLAYNRVFKNIAQDIDLSGAGTTAEATISENDVVSVIVVVDGQSLADSYLVTGSYSSLTNYILSSEGQAASRLITAEQKDILSEFGRSGIDFGLSLSYSAVTNAIAVDVKYGDIEKIRNVHGVKSVFVAPEFKAPSTDFIVESVQTNAQGAELFDSNGMLVNTSAYRGENMVVAVIDTGVDYKHPAFQADPSAYILTEKDITSLWPYMIASTFIARNQLIPVKSTIFTNKVPYGFNYADGTPSPIPTSASYNKGFGLEHGTHVAGIIAGNNEEIRGAAPEAQILAMKVASNTSGSLPYTAILAAINDAAVLGADAMNMSYGSGCGPVTEEGAYDYLDDIYELCGKIGIAMCAATGNDGEAAYISGGSYTANPDTGVIGSPSSYTSTFSVGSYSAGRVLYLKCGNNDIQYINARTSQGEDLDFSKLDETGESAEFEYIALGLGRESDYEGKDVSGKIALVQRGEISFSEKAKTAAEHGAKGVIVYNNEKNALFRCQVDVTEIPVCSITMENGTVLASENQGKITVSRKFSYIPMSYFSSQGPVSNLDIGVDIAAPGGSIRSSVPLLYQSAEKLSTPYSVMSGTSMATPNLTAVALVVRQYLKANFPYLTNIEVQHCIYKLLMSTSDIAYNTDGTPITPRKQGSGYVNVEKALASEAYLSVTGSDKSKLNLR